MIRLCSFVLCGSMFLAVSAAHGLERPSYYSLEVSGWQNGSSTYELSVDFKGDLGEAAYDAITVRLASDRVPLVVQLPAAALLKRPALGTRVGAQNGLFSNIGTLKAFSHHLLLPYTAGVSAVDVLLVEAHREDEVVALVEAHVDPRGFHFKTTHGTEALEELFTVDHPDGTFAKSACSSGLFRHCCSGGNCSNTCICCTGPAFFCSLITCEIECITD